MTQLTINIQVAYNRQLQQSDLKTIKIQLISILSENSSNWLQTWKNITRNDKECPPYHIQDTVYVRLVGWGLTALLTQFRSYRAFKVKTISYIVNITDLIEINSWSKVNEKEKNIYNSTRIRLNEEVHSVHNRIWQQLVIISFSALTHLNKSDSLAYTNHMH